MALASGQYCSTLPMLSPLFLWLAYRLISVAPCCADSVMHDVTIEFYAARLSIRAGAMIAAAVKYWRLTSLLSAVNLAILLRRDSAHSAYTGIMQRYSSAAQCRRFDYVKLLIPVVNVIWKPAYADAPAYSRTTRLCTKYQPINQSIVQNTFIVYGRNGNGMTKGKRDEYIHLYSPYRWQEMLKQT